MNDKKLTRMVQERSRRLTKLRQRMLTQTPEEALASILESKNPAELVHSFPEEDFYFLVQDIGPQDALPVLTLASARQLEYLLDIDLWQRDTINLAAAEKWFDLLMKADPRRMAQWFSHEKIDLLEFFLFKTIDVKVRQQDQDPSDFGPDYITFDETVYFRFFKFPQIVPAAETAAEKDGEDADFGDREQSLLHFIQQIADLDYTQYIKILMESASVIPAEAEEELYRLRNVRLAEKGFAPLEASVGIYQTLSPGELDRSGRKVPARTEDFTSSLPAPFSPSQMLATDSSFAKALSTIRKESVGMQLQSEFATLCNQLMVADRKGDITRESLRAVVKKACGFISIGIENLPGRPTDLIQTYPLVNLFRVGYGFALKLKRRAEKWRAESWFAANGLPLSFWGEEWLGVIGGLLLKRPLYFDNYETQVLYRDFNTGDDVLKTERQLNAVIAFDTLLSRLPLQLKASSGPALLTYKNLILTLWARHDCGLDDRTPELLPLPLDAFRTFFQQLWRPGKKPRSVKRAMKHEFLKWLSQSSGLAGAEITGTSGDTLERLFLEIESEYGAVDARSVDPRFIPHFLVAR